MMINFKKKQKLIWITEIVFWVLIFVIFGVGIMLFNYYHHKSLNTYHLFIPDVDGLIVGSPVKMMGVPIGYVTQIEIINDVVYVRFVVGDKSIKLPRGSIVNVEFMGLGGSKSLEIYTPDEEVEANPGSFLVVKDTMRLKDAVGLIDVIFNKIMDISYRCTYFMQEINKPKGLIHNAFSVDSEYAQDFLNKLNSDLDNMMKLRKRCKNGKKGNVNE